MNGNRLKNIREKRGMTQNDLAKRCKIASKQIWRYENDESEPGATHLKKLALTLQVSSDYLLGLVDEYEERYAERDLTDFQDYVLTLARGDDLNSAIYVLKAVHDRIRELADELPTNYLYKEK